VDLFYPYHLDYHDGAVLIHLGYRPAGEDYFMV
jgi:hypothetical protein